MEKTKGRKKKVRKKRRKEKKRKKEKENNRSKKIDKGVGNLGQERKAANLETEAKGLVLEIFHK